MLGWFALSSSKRNGDDDNEIIIIVIGIILIINYYCLIIIIMIINKTAPWVAKFHVTSWRSVSKEPFTCFIILFTVSVCTEYYICNSIIDNHWAFLPNVLGCASSASFAIHH